MKNYLKKYSKKLAENKNEFINFAPQEESTMKSKLGQQLATIQNESSKLALLLESPTIPVDKVRSLCAHRQVRMVNVGEFIK